MKKLILSTLILFFCIGINAQELSIDQVEGGVKFTISASGVVKYYSNSTTLSVRIDENQKIRVSDNLGNTPFGAFHFSDVAVNGSILASVELLLAELNNLLSFSSPVSVKDYDVSLNRVPGQTSVNRSGKNNDVDIVSTPETIWLAGGTKTWQTTAQTIFLYSTSANDSVGGSGCDSVTIYGVDADYQLTEETIATPGTDTTTTSVSFLDVYEIKVVSGNINEGELAFFYTSTKDVAAFIDSAVGQTKMGTFTTPVGKSLILNNIVFSNFKSGSQNADVVLLVREFANGPFLYKREFGVPSGSPVQITFNPPLLFGEKSQLEFRVVSVTADDTKLTADFDGILIDN